MRDPRRQLLQRRVDERVGHRAELGRLTGRDLAHAFALERDRVDRAGDGQVVADHDRVAALFRRPPPHPLAPRAVGAEAAERRRVVREVVLGEEVHHQRDAGCGRDRRAGGVPLLAGDESRGPGSTARARGGTTPWSSRGGGRTTSRRPVGGRPAGRSWSPRSWSLPHPTGRVGAPFLPGGRSVEQVGAMELSKALEFVRNHRQGVLTTLRRDGRPADLEHHLRGSTARRSGSR